MLRLACWVRGTNVSFFSASKANLQQTCPFLTTISRKMAARTRKRLQERGRDTPTKGLLWKGGRGFADLLGEAVHAVDSIRRARRGRGRMCRLAFKAHRLVHHTTLGSRVTHARPFEGVFTSQFTTDLSFLTTISHKMASRTRKRL